MSTELHLKQNENVYNLNISYIGLFQKKKPYTPCWGGSTFCGPTLLEFPAENDLTSLNFMMNFTALEFWIFTDFQSLPLWNSAYFWQIFVYPYGIPLHFKTLPLGMEMDLLNRGCTVFFWKSPLKFCKMRLDQWLAMPISFSKIWA